MQRKDDQPDPSTLANRKDLAKRALAALEQVPLRYGATLKAVAIDDLPHEEAAVQLGLKPNPVTVQVRRGLVHWREQLGADPLGLLPA